MLRSVSRFKRFAPADFSGLSRFVRKRVLVLLSCRSDGDAGEHFVRKIWSRGPEYQGNIVPVDISIKLLIFAEQISQDYQDSYVKRPGIWLRFRHDALTVMLVDTFVSKIWSRDSEKKGKRYSCWDHHEGFFRFVRQIPEDSQDSYLRQDNTWSDAFWGLSLKQGWLPAIRFRCLALLGFWNINSWCSIFFRMFLSSNENDSPRCGFAVSFCSVFEKWILRSTSLW